MRANTSFTSGGDDVIEAAVTVLILFILVFGTSLFNAAKRDTGPDAFLVLVGVAGIITSIVMVVHLA
jgi:hypothetical protein